MVGHCQGTTGLELKPCQDERDHTRIAGSMSEQGKLTDMESDSQYFFVAWSDMLLISFDY